MGDARKKKRPAVKGDPKNLLTSLILVFPLFLLYQAGVLLTWPVQNGADLLTRFLFVNLGLTKTAYLGYTACVALAYVIALAILRRRQSFQLRIAIPMLLESAIYALTMGSLIVLVMTRVFHVDPRLAVSLAGQSFVDRLVMSLGAGVWEETVFRLGLLSAFVWLFESVLGTRRGLAVFFGLLLSAFLFSAAHHIPPYGDPLHLGVFTFRVLAGVIFGLVFWFRGFATAVYTHALYDLYVLVLHP